MPFKKGNKLGGRKTAREEAQKILNMDLSNQLYNERLELIKKKKPEERTDQELNDFVKPLSLKSIVEKKDILSGGEKITGINYIIPKEDATE